MSYLVTVVFQGSSNDSIPTKRIVRPIRASARLSRKSLARLPKDVARAQRGPRRAYERVKYGGAGLAPSSLTFPVSLECPPAPLNTTSDLMAYHSSGKPSPSPLLAEMSDDGLGDVDPNLSLRFRLSDEEIQAIRAKLSSDASSLSTDEDN